MSDDENIARAGIFERLIDNEPFQKKDPTPMRTFNTRELMVSVALNISHLLNTRSSYNFDELEKMERSVLNFGIPELTYQSLGGESDKNKISKIIKDTIMFYEPRLKNIMVTCMSETSCDKIFFQIDGEYTNEYFAQPVSFPISIENIYEKVIVNVG